MKRIPTPLGRWIREGLADLRSSRNQNWLAEKVGIEAAQISRIITGTSDTKAKTLSAIADALGKPRSQIFRVAGYIEKVTELEQDVEELIYEFSKLPQSERRQIIEIIRIKQGKEKNPP